jgi:hypothetical protein
VDISRARDDAAEAGRHHEGVPDLRSARGPEAAGPEAAGFEAASFEAAVSSIAVPETALGRRSGTRRAITRRNRRTRRALCRFGAGTSGARRLRNG